jgi:hypothetical protein
VGALLLDLVLNELKARGVQDVDKYGPYYVISYACHAFNLYNKESKIFRHGGLVKSIRVPIVHMGPPGCGKSYFLEQLGGSKEMGIFSNDKLLFPVKYEQKITDAGLVGTVAPNPNDPEKPIIKKGVAENHKTALVLVDEFTDLMKAMVSQYGVSAETLLSVLDSGRVVNAMANGEYEYETNLTMWCGIQPVKCDMSGGLGRRLCILLNIPSSEDEERYKEASRNSDNVEIDPERYQNMMDMIRMWTSTVTMIKKVQFTDRIYEFLLKDLRAKNYIIELYKKMAIGYAIASKGGGETLVVDLDDKLEKIIRQAHQWRNQVMQGPEIQQIVSIMINNGMKVEGTYTIARVTLNILAAETAGLSALQVNKIISSMKSNGYVTIKGNAITLVPEMVSYYETGKIEVAPCQKS